MSSTDPLTEAREALRSILNDPMVTDRWCTEVCWPEQVRTLARLDALPAVADSGDGRVSSTDPLTEAREALRLALRIGENGDESEPEYQARIRSAIDRCHDALARLDALPAPERLGVTREDVVFRCSGWFYRDAEAAS